MRATISLDGKIIGEVESVTITFDGREEQIIFKKGERVKVNNKPRGLWYLRGLEGIVKKVTGEFVIVKFHGYPNEVAIRPDWLEKIPWGVS